MSEIIITLISALLMYILYYRTLDILDKKVHLGIARKGNRINSRAVYIIGVVMAIAWMAISLTNVSMTLPQRILNICMLWALAVLAVTDWKKHMIPNCILVPILTIWAVVTGITLFIDATNVRASFLSSLAGGIIGGLLFFVCYLLTRRQLGAGDVKLVFILGLYLTEQKILGAILAGMILCCVYMLILMIKRNGKRNDDRNDDRGRTPKGGIPLAPFLFLGTLVVLFV